MIVSFYNLLAISWQVLRHKYCHSGVDDVLAGVIYHVLPI